MSQKCRAVEETSTLKIWYRPIDRSAETERMLDEARVRLDVDNQIWRSMPRCQKF
jgi:hypothetical protein